MVVENTKERSVFAIFSNREPVNLYISAFGTGGHVSAIPTLPFETLILFFSRVPIQPKVCLLNWGSSLSRLQQTTVINPLGRQARGFNLL